MPHLFVRDQDREWAVLPVEEESYLLSVYPPRRIGDPREVKSLRSQVILMPGTEGRWLMQWGALQDVRVNGIRQTLGLRILAHRDEIKVGGADAVFFSTEKLARVADFPGGDRPAYCARCKSPIAKGVPSVQCPMCRVWYHQQPADERPCWTYRERCVFCTQPTDFAAGFRWTPEGI